MASPGNLIEAMYDLATAQELMRSCDVLSRKKWTWHAIAMLGVLVMGIGLKDVNVNIVIPGFCASALSGLVSLYYGHKKDQKINQILRMARK